MNDNIKGSSISTLAVCALALIVGFLAVYVLFLKPLPPIEQKPVNVGALSGPDIPYNYLSVGGVQTYSLRSEFTATSSVPWSLENPAAATTSIESVSCRMTATGLSGAQAFYVGTSSTRYGSSTPSLMANVTVASGGTFAKLFVPGGNATTTRADTLWLSNVDGSSNAILGPSEYLTLRIATGTAGTFSSYWTGSCSAVLRVL